MTKDNYMIEGFWTGMKWINVHDNSKVECDSWRSLPNLGKIYSKTSNECVDIGAYTYKTEKFRRMQRVKYDKNGKMKCISY
jgi:hypothetical protein